MGTKEKQNYQKGVTLFIAVSVTIISLLFTVAISNLTLKELILTQTGRDSQIAFYAANTGTECVLYHDTEVGNGFNPVDPTEEIFTVDVFCVNASKKVQMIRSDNIWRGTLITAFYMTGNSNDPCFRFDIEKEATIDPGDPPVITEIKTTIETRGYNTCNIEDSRRVERAIRVNY